MKFVKATMHKDLRDVNGIDAFAQHNVYWTALRCTTHNETTIMIFGEDWDMDAFMAQYGHRSIMTQHYNGIPMPAPMVVEVFKSRGMKIHPMPTWMDDDGE